MQIEITGEDWLSSSDKKRRSKAIADRKKAAIACAIKLGAASDALAAYISACEECNDGSGSRGNDDSRLVLIRALNECRGWIESKYT